MKYIVLILILTLVGCREKTVVVDLPGIETKPVSQLPSEPTETPNPEHVGEGAIYTEIPKQFPSATGFFTVKISTLNCPIEQQKKYSQAEEFITKLVNSTEFKDAVLGFQYNAKSQFNWNEGMSNETIYSHIVKGAEALLPLENYQMDITAECYTDRWSKTIGYTNPKTIKIFANMKYHKAYSSCEVASNTFHEWLHKMGFDHSKNYSKARDFTVPYGIGYIVRDVCKSVLSGKSNLKPLGASLL